MIDKNAIIKFLVKESTPVTYQKGCQKNITGIDQEQEEEKKSWKAEQGKQENTH